MYSGNITFMDIRQDYAPGPPPRLTYEDMFQRLTQAGLKHGDNVTFHVSLSSIGWMIGGAEALLDALLDRLGPAGTVMMPRFPPYGSLDGPFDCHHPPPSGTGTVPDALGQRQGAVISIHPTHSVVALGPEAEFLTARHYTVSPVGIGSPFDRMAEIGGLVLLLGVNHLANTTIHTGEAYAGVAYWGRPRPDRPDGLWVLDEKRNRRWVQLREIPGDAKGFNRIEPFLVERGLIAFGRIGRARTRLIPSQPLIEAVTDYLEEEPDGLLCDQPDCFPCNLARHYLHLKRGTRRALNSGRRSPQSNPSLP